MREEVQGLNERWRIALQHVVPRDGLRSPLNFDVKQQMRVIQIGTDSEHVRLSLPSSFSSEGWAQAQVEIAVAGLSARIEPWIEAVDLLSFAKQLRVVFDTLQGVADYAPLEEQFTLRIEAGTSGNMLMSGHASSSTFENKLVFKLQIDQSYLARPLSELEQLVNESSNAA